MIARRYLAALPLPAVALPAMALLLGAAAGAPETRMKDVIAQEVPRHEALLEKLVRQNSGSLNIAGVKTVGDMMRAELEPLGFAVEWVDMTATGRAGHVVATHKGNGRGKRVLLIGHLDTVFEPDSPFTGWSREGDRVTGPGVGDDKGGLVVIVATLRAMQAAGTLKNADIKIVLTGDEEKTGAPLATARKDLIEAGKWADVALEYENLAVDGTQEFATTARRSSTNWEIITSGRTGHSSGIFNASMGYGAVYELARILDEFRRTLPERNLTFNVSVVVGGTPAVLDAAGVKGTAEGKTNVIPARAVARGDLRSLSPEQDIRIKAAMEGIVAKHLPGTDASIRFFEGYPSMPPTAGNRALMDKLNQVNRDLGLPEMQEMDPAKRGAADSSFVAADAVTLGGMGASGGGAHAVGEWVDLRSLPRQAMRSAALISRLTAEPRTK
ncbi:M20/M25/M40 family metallo-hydrolase [Sphingomonas sp. IC4-52]|uniref:M20/M25/M40 family metallo-hydrolase n=1 Tax=Sphingomonas sp. IC4-52 TaxID=2887202 RepID=UPI001D121508|nr:M20/M25/M40 family metallo-hydrolase [Sphingomonas sp. IC4-52]MCC2980414.1 M20/M25/M40 family metallo-hydrolase [Sphingomonas sp. IC4-52]